MITRVHGFDWEIYAERVMPAFARWLIERDESAICQLYERTRCALEEQFLPATMHRLRAWPRARTFVDALPRGPHSRREYAKLCAAEQFTTLSDHYLHSYTPHLYQDSAALRTIWGAVIEEYCLPWFHAPQGSEPAQQAELIEQEQDFRSELISLLNAAGMTELAQQVNEKSAGLERVARTPEQADQTPPDGEEEEAEPAGPQGILLGSQSQILRLRGWMAGSSTRAMVLFEYLACGRRRMPFGYEAGEAFGAFRGYLAQDEVWQLAASLRSVHPPQQAEAEQDHELFCMEQAEDDASYRLVDEVLPSNAHDLLAAVRQAAAQGLGMICSVD